MLIVPHRHVQSWPELDSTEQDALLGAIRHAQDLIAGAHPCDGFNVGFNQGAAAGQTVPHFHLHVIPRSLGDVADPRGGVRNVIPSKGNYLLEQQNGPREGRTRSTPHGRALISGSTDGLIDHLLHHIDAAVEIDAAVSFVLESGVRLVRPHLQEFLDRGGRLRFLTGDYMDVTDPDALRRLLDLEGRVELFVFEAGTTGFHPKSWVFRLHDGSGVALVGSSNLSATALKTGIEWNLRSIAPDCSGDWEAVSQAFAALVSRPEVQELSHEWIDRYEARRASNFQKTAILGVAPEPEPTLPEPHTIQRKALAALQETRREGFSAGLVVLATGLGKTWLSAFDSNRPEFRRILFVAHREEILSQALETFRRTRPHANLGRYDGSQKDLQADVLFASIQTLGRVAHLRNFAPDHFDYIVVDEFHHAAAATYRKLIEHFDPRFMLGLTATPDRTDGADLLGLCQENLVYRCDAFEGIEAGLLAQFSYFGVPDQVDYAQIPWRGTRFDDEALTTAVATQARAQNALEQLQKLGGSKTIAFCVSQRHADFMASYLSDRGIRTAAVHSGPSSAPRATSLEALEAGDLDVVCAVDMFNEGVDVPSIDTVLMLRPTESSVIWLQQFGRGLRRAEGKDRLRVIDYIGNHRVFLTKARALLQCSPGDRALALALEDVLKGEVDLPAGCEVTYDLEAVDLLRGLLRSTGRGDALESFYQDYKLRFGSRPTALDVYHSGFNPRATGHGSWFEFVEDQGDLSSKEDRALRAFNDLLDLVSTTRMTKSYKLLLLQALRREDCIPGEITIDRLTAKFAELVSRHPAYREDVSVPLSEERLVRQLLEQNPIAAWTGGRSPAGKQYFSYDGEVFSARFAGDQGLLPALGSMLDEVIQWRLAEYLGRAGRGGGDELDLFGGRRDGGGGDQVELWREYMREEIPPLFGLQFNTGSWNQGFVVQGKKVFLLVTLDKSDLQDDHKYEDGFVSPTALRWQSQNRAAQGSTHGQIIRQTLPGYELHLFVRPTKKRSQGATPFIYCGEVDFTSWAGEKPITVMWALRNAVPAHLLRTLQVPS